MNWIGQYRNFSVSEVWKHFQKEKNHGICDICAEKIARIGGNTSSMIKHLKLKHNIKLTGATNTQSTRPNATKNHNSLSIECAGPPAKKEKTQQTLTNFVKRERPSRNEILARCAAEDGFSIAGELQIVCTFKNKF
jgi:cobalamin biosynthesis protein CbiD